jgi:hypothetical protein
MSLLLNSSGQQSTSIIDKNHDPTMSRQHHDDTAAGPDEMTSLLRSLNNNDNNDNNNNNKNERIAKTAASDNDCDDEVFEPTITYLQLLVQNSNFRFSWLAYVANHTVCVCLFVSDGVLFHERNNNNSNNGI